MKVTSDLLLRLQAYKHWFEVLKKYPSGAELTDLLQDTDLDLEDLYFARHYFNFSEEELKIYNERCKIIECGGHVLRSFNINNSNWIYNSENIKNSNFVSNSENVLGSSEIKSAINVVGGTDIINSKDIKYSVSIADSDNISASHDIINSSYIDWSNIINSSSNLKDCEFCYKSQNLQDCHFCGFVTNSKHCIFCNNITDSEYQIFNKSVTINEFELVKSALSFQLDAEKVHLINIDENRHLDARFSYDLRFDRMFEQLSENFYGWVGSLPQFDEQIFLLLFFTTLK